MKKSETRAKRLIRLAQRTPRRHRQWAMAEMILAALVLAFAVYNAATIPFLPVKVIFALISIAILIVFMSYVFYFIDSHFERRAERESR